MPKPALLTLVPYLQAIWNKLEVHRVVPGQVRRECVSHGPMVAGIYRNKRSELCEQLARHRWSDIFGGTKYGHQHGIRPS